MQRIPSRTVMSARSIVLITVVLPVSMAIRTARRGAVADPRTPQSIWTDFTSSRSQLPIIPAMREPVRASRGETLITSAIDTIQVRAVSA